MRKGFIVLAMDPVGQGERLQYYDPEQARSLVGGSTTEHSYFGKQCFLAGSSAARYFTWNGIRAIDYLVSRPEVDANRIGVTGISGGGTQTSYIAALDDRVAAAAPTCRIAGFRRLLESIGPLDAGSNHRAMIYIHPQGKSAAAAPGGEIEQLLKQGYAVLAPDISRIGEAGRTSDAIAFKSRRIPNVLQNSRTLLIKPQIIRNTAVVAPGTILGPSS